MIKVEKGKCFIVRHKHMRAPCKYMILDTDVKDDPHGTIKLSLITEYKSKGRPHPDLYEIGERVMVVERKWFEVESRVIHEPEE